MRLQNTTHWHTGSTRPPIIVIIAGNMPRLDILISRLDDLLYTVSRLLELLLILIAILLTGIELAVGLCNHLYGAYSGYNEAIIRWFSKLVYVPVYRGIG